MNTRSTNPTSAPRGDQRASWIKCYDCPEGTALMRESHDAFVLLYWIAFYASPQGVEAEGLRPGQCVIHDRNRFSGHLDHKVIGMPRKRFTAATRLLERKGYAAFAPVGEGILASMTSTAIFDPDPENPAAAQEINERADR